MRFLVDQLQVQRGLGHLVHDGEDVCVAGGVLLAGLGKLLAQVGVHPLLRLAHLDEVHLVGRLGDLEAHVLGRAPHDVLRHDLAQLIEVLEARRHQGLLDALARGEHVVALELAEAIQEVFAVADAKALELLGRHVAEHRVDFQRAVLRRRGRQHVDALAAVLLAQPLRLEPGVEGPIRLALAAEELRLLAEPGARRVQVLVGMPLVHDQHVDGELVEVDGVGALAELAIGLRLLELLADLLDALVAGVAELVAALHPEVLAEVLVLGLGVQVQLVVGVAAHEDEVVVVLREVVVLAVALGRRVRLRLQVAGLVSAVGLADHQDATAGEPHAGFSHPVRQHRLRHDERRLLGLAVHLGETRQHQAAKRLPQAHVVGNDAFAVVQRPAQAVPVVVVGHALAAGRVQTRNVDRSARPLAVGEAAELAVVDVLDAVAHFGRQEPGLELGVPAVDDRLVVFAQARAVQVLLQDVVVDSRRDHGVQTAVERDLGVGHVAVILAGGRRCPHLGTLGIQPGLDGLAGNPAAGQRDFDVLQRLRCDGLLQASRLQLVLLAHAGVQVRLLQRGARGIQLWPQLAGQVLVHRSPLAAASVGVGSAGVQQLAHAQLRLAAALRQLGHRERAGVFLRCQRGGRRLDAALDPRGLRSQHGIAQPAVAVDGADEAVQGLVLVGCLHDMLVLHRHAVAPDVGLQVSSQVGVDLAAQHGVDARRQWPARCHGVVLHHLVDAVPAQRLALQHVGDAVDGLGIAGLAVGVGAHHGATHGALHGRLVAAQSRHDGLYVWRRADRVRLELGDAVRHACHAALDGVDFAERAHRGTGAAEQVAGAAALEVGAGQELGIPDTKLLQHLLVDRHQRAGDVVGPLAQPDDVSRHVGVAGLERRVGHALRAQELGFAEHALAERAAALAFHDGGRHHQRDDAAGLGLVESGVDKVGLGGFDVALVVLRQAATRAVRRVADDHLELAAAVAVREALQALRRHQLVAVAVQRHGARQTDGVHLDAGDAVAGRRRVQEHASRAARLQGGTCRAGQALDDLPHGCRHLGVGVELVQAVAAAAVAAVLAHQRRVAAAVAHHLGHLGVDGAALGLGDSGLHAERRRRVVAAVGQGLQAGVDRLGLRVLLRRLGELAVQRAKLSAVGSLPDQGLKMVMADPQSVCANLGLRPPGLDQIIDQLVVLADQPDLLSRVGPVLHSVVQLGVDGSMLFRDGISGSRLDSSRRREQVRRLALLRSARRLRGAALEPGGHLDHRLPGHAGHLGQQALLLALRQACQRARHRGIAAVPGHPGVELRRLGGRRRRVAEQVGRGFMPLVHRQLGRDLLHAHVRRDDGAVFPHRPGNLHRGVE